MNVTVDTEDLFPASSVRNDDNSELASVCHDFLVGVLGRIELSLAIYGRSPSLCEGNSEHRNLKLWKPSKH